MPDYIREAFIYSFTVGLNQPDKRLIEKQWLDILLRLRGDICSCSCGAQSFVNTFEKDDDGKLVCLCGTHFAAPLQITDGKTRVLLSEGSVLFNDMLSPIGEVVRNKLNPSLWGLKNRSYSTWNCILPNGQEKEIAPEGAAPIFVGTKIDIGGISYVIEESE